MALRPADDYDRDILDIIPERFDADADSHQARAGAHLRTGLTLAIAVVAVGGIVATGLHFVGGRQRGGSIPVIKADERPIKVRPDDRGGMQVPNQDKLIYERMEPTPEGDAKVERLLPPAEAPMAPPRTAAAAMAQPQPVEPPASAKPEAIRVPTAQATAKAPPPQPVAAVQPVAPPAVAPPPVSSYQPTQARAPQVIAPQAAVAPPPVAAPPKVAAIVAPPAPPPPAPVAAPVAVSIPKAPPSGDYVVQLGAVRAEDLAEKEWSRIAKTNHDVLGALSPDIVRVDLEGKGTFWRVRAGPLSEQAARQLCQELTSRSQGCIVARK